MCFLFFIFARTRRRTLWWALCAFKHARLKARRPALVVARELTMVLENFCREERVSEVEEYIPEGK